MHKNQINCDSVGVFFVTEREGRVRFLQLRLCQYFTMNAVSVMAVSVLVLKDFATPMLLWLCGLIGCRIIPVPELWP